MSSFIGIVISPRSIIRCDRLRNGGGERGRSPFDFLVLCHSKGFGLHCSFDLWKEYIGRIRVESPWDNKFLDLTELVHIDNRLCSYFGVRLVYRNKEMTE